MIIHLWSVIQIIKKLKIQIRQSYVIVLSHKKFWRKAVDNNMLYIWRNIFSVVYDFKGHISKAYT